MEGLNFGELQFINFMDNIFYIVCKSLNEDHRLPSGFSSSDFMI
jgi:hypothetical protein